MLIPGVAENLKQSPDWQALHQHILECVAILDSIDGIDFTDANKAAIQGEGKKAAKKILKEILEPFLLEEESTVDRKSETAGKTGML